MPKKVINLSRESAAERQILDYLNSLPNTKAVKWSQEGRQKGNPDILCSHHGMMILIETKQVGKVQSLLQSVTMDEWRATGVITCVATELDHVKPMMEDIMRERSKIIEELEGK